MPGQYLKETEIRQALSAALGDSRFQLWFGEGVRIGFDSSFNALEMLVPNAFFKDWLRNHYSTQILAVGAQILGRPIADLVIQLADAPATPIVPATPAQSPEFLFNQITNPPQPAPEQTNKPAPYPKFEPQTQANFSSTPHKSETSSPVSPTQPTSGRKPATRPLKRLDEFIVGNSNRLAYSAALDMVNYVGSAFNPLIIYGDIGVGKTHLLEGVSAGVRGKHPHLRVIQLTAESFTNRFLEAMRGNSLTGFRAKHRAADVFIVDDAHFLAAKRATQNEFLHTFNALINEGAAIIITMDQHPKMISKLTDELATRFMGGMVVKINPPDFATRKEILKTKAYARRVELPDPVISFVAEHLRSSVRELEGALNSLIAQASFAGRRLDLSLAKVALRDTIRHTAQAIALKDVERVVAKLFQVDPESLKSDNRSRTVSYPRMLAMYLARKHTGAAYGEIGRYFGGRNHSTVMAAEKRVETWIEDKKHNVTIAGFETTSDVLTALEHSLGEL